MGKRKQAAPHYADQAKRQQLQWNMTEQFGPGGSGSQQFINDNTLKDEDFNHSSEQTSSSASTVAVNGADNGSSSCTLVHALCVDAFYQNLASCHTTLTLRKPPDVRVIDKSQLLEFGHFKITLMAHPKLTPLPDQLPEFKECWLYLADGDNPSMLYFETEDNNENVVQQKSKSRQSKFGVFWFTSLSVPVAALTGLKNKSFLLQCNEFDTQRKDFTVTIYGTSALIMQVGHPSEAIRVKMPQVGVQRLMEYFYDIRLPYNFEGRERTTGHDFFLLYESVMSIQEDRLSNDFSWSSEVANIHHDCLKPKLRQYQKQSVAWMLRQEKHCRINSEDESDLHPLYCKVNLRNGTTLYYNRHAGSLIKDRPKAIPNLPGGILADEMGLGKTVEVLCCMLLHPRSDVELPEALPVLEESPSASNDTSRSPTPHDTGDKSSHRNDNQANSQAAQKEEISGPTAMDIDNEGLKPDSKLDTVKDHHEGRVAGQSVEDVCSKVTVSVIPSVSVSESQHHGRDNNPLLSASGDNSKDEVMLSNMDSISVELAPPAPKFEVEQDEITFLSSKSTVDLTDETECESTDINISTSHSQSSSMDQGAQYTDSMAEDSLEQNLLNKPRTNSGSEINLNPGGSKVIIKINANKEASVIVEHSGNFQGLSSSESPLTNSMGVSSVSLQSPIAGTVTSWENSALNPSTQLYTPVSSAAATVASSVPLQGSQFHQVSSSNAASGSAEDNVQQEKKKSKRKSKGFVEYVPWTQEDKNYFSVKATAQKQFFECNCGQLEDEEETRKKGMHTVKCNMCGMSQHAECMNYDLSDPYRGEYKCPHCHAVSTTIKSGATLIVSPYSICHQWIEEISKHIKERSIKVFIYTGVSKLGYIQPQTLAQQDIVITTYDVLRKEVDYVNLPHTNSESGRRFRHPKRFLATPSPMVAVEWWRICLDEAQMVECVTTKTAEMALKLKAVNRWCVTGTPLMRSVEDIYGLLLFLGVDPLFVQQWFRSLVWEPFCHGFSAPMHHALSKVLWRTAKKDVIDQIDLPVQSEEMNWLTFSPVEEHFYRRQYEVYLRNAYAYHKRIHTVQDPNTKLHALDRKTMNELLSPLFRLRQACCHPQIVRGEFLPLNKSMMTMEELLEHMTKKVKTECEEAHRQIVASLNGMAGLAIIRGKLSDAVEKYRDVLRSVEEHKDQFRTDELQRLHAMHNLAEVLDKKPAGVSPTLRDASLKEQCEDLKTKYMSRSKANVVSSQETLIGTQNSLKQVNEKLAALDSDWWADVVDMTVQRGIDMDLIYKIKDDLVRTSTTEGTIADIFTSADGLMYVIDSHLQMLTKARQTLTTELEQLSKDTSPELVQKAATCCMRPVEEILKMCPFCKVDELFNEYESKLFLFVEKGVTVTGDDSNLAYQVSTKRQGTWADSEVERALKSILAFYRLQFDTDSDILEAAALQIKYLDTLKKEFKNLRSLWLSHREMISAVDELEMATERLRLREKFEPESATKILNVIEEREMMQHELKCSSDEIVGRDDLRKKLGQLVYLTNLAKKNHDGQESNPDSCPICQCELGVEWSVLMCGHCYCLRCIRTLIDRNLIGGHLLDRRLKCPVCRHMTPVREISYVTTKKTEKVNVKGSHSTKVQAVIECLIKIRQQDPTAKSLVFSVWVSVLDILAAALAENKIPYKSLHDPNYFQKNLTAFKSEDSIQVLLLPLHTGANGLNLVEANNVLLVEPELNLEEEAQAISRIYRIGQTRPTKIHRFLVRGTIEEKIFHMVKTLRESKTGQSDDGETIELTVGHITSLLQQPSPDEDDDDDDDVGMQGLGGREGSSGNNQDGVGASSSSSGGVANNDGAGSSRETASGSTSVSVSGSGGDRGLDNNNGVQANESERTEERNIESSSFSLTSSIRSEDDSTSTGNPEELHPNTTGTGLETDASVTTSSTNAGGENDSVTQAEKHPSSEASAVAGTSSEAEESGNTMQHAEGAYPETSEHNNMALSESTTSASNAVHEDGPAMEVEDSSQMSNIHSVASSEANAAIGDSANTDLVVSAAPMENPSETVDSTVTLCSQATVSTNADQSD